MGGEDQRYDLELASTPPPRAGVRPVLDPHVPSSVPSWTPRVVRGAVPGRTAQHGTGRVKKRLRAMGHTKTRKYRKT